MPGTLLRTGNLKEFHPLGAVGNPVYLSASQLRSALRRRLGTEVADALAIPQRNEDGDTIDWYAPMSGPVVPWSAATADERGRTKAQLLQIRERIRETGQVMRAEENSERRIFGQLLDLVTTFPNDGHVYLVNGHPVITFWGFQEHNAPPGSDPLLLLPEDDGRAAAPSSTEESVATTAPSRRRFPWWWLLPLLLLLLLLLFLKMCSEQVYEPSGPEPSVERAPNDQPEKLGEQPDPASPDAIEQVQGGDRILGTSSADGTVEEEAAVPPENPVGSTDRELPTEGIDSGEPLADESSDEGARDQENGQPIPEQSPQDEKNGQPTQGNGAPGEEGIDTALEQKSPASTEPLGPDLEIPQEALESGSIEFLNGRWNSSTTLIDSDTGRPIELEYGFQDGAGTVTLKRDGVVCTGKTAASVQNGRLVISDADDITCPDGTRYRGSRVECSVNAQGQADCSGSYPTGDTFSTRIRKSE